MIDSFSLWQTLADTSWWYYAFFIYLMQISWLATKPRKTSLRNIFLIPVIFLVTAISGVIFILHPNLNDIAMALGACCAGFPIGWLHFRLIRIKAIKDENKLHIPGTWSMFIIIFLLLTAKYYYGWTFGMDINAVKFGAYNRELMILYGLVTGLMMGRLYYSVRCMKRGPFATA